MSGTVISESHYYDDPHMWDIYNASFPIHETRPEDHTLEMLRTRRDYRLFTARTDRTIGFALVYVFDDFALLDYMAVAEPYRCDGIGGEMLRYVTAQRYGPVLLEIQKENGTRDNIRRIGFYKRCGARVMLENYYLPSYTSEPDEEMYLMTCGTDVSYTPKQVGRYVSEIYHTVYGRTRNDLLKRSGLPV